MIGPIAAPHHAQIALSRCPGTTILWCSDIRLVPAVLSTFPYVAQHIREPEWISSKAPGRPRLFLIPTATASVAIGVVVADGTTPPARRPRTRARRILPLRLARQPVRTISFGGQAAEQLAIQPSKVGFDVLPIHADHGITIRLRKARVLPTGVLPKRIRMIYPNSAAILDRISCFEGSELTSRHRILSHSEGSTETDLMLGVFESHVLSGTFDFSLWHDVFEVARRFLCRRPHQKTTCRDHHHLGTVRTVAKRLAHLRGLLIRTGDGCPAESD